MRKGYEKSRRPLCEVEDIIFVLLKCSDMRKWGKQFLVRIWLIINDEVFCKRIINCSH
jgi:hypothetical protein